MLAPKLENIADTGASFVAVTVIVLAPSLSGFSLSIDGAELAHFVAVVADNWWRANQAARALKAAGQVCARMGAYKPRTSPYSFQGYGKQCLPYVFELAGKYGIRVISMEITRDEHLDEIRDALRQTGDPTGVMLQIGTRNTQNFELLKTVGSQRDFPILLKRGFGITLHESLLAAEYVASAGNRDIVFCLRGMKTNFGDPHRNLIDFGHVPVVKRLTRMPVCIDPSHSVGSRSRSSDGIAAQLVSTNGRSRRGDSAWMAAIDPALGVMLWPKLVTALSLK